MTRDRFSVMALGRRLSTVTFTVAGLLLTLLCPNQGAAQQYSCPNNWPTGECKQTECAISGSGTCDPVVTWTVNGRTGQGYQVCQCAQGNLFYQYCDLGYGGTVCDPGPPPICGCGLACFVVEQRDHPCPPAVQPIEVSCRREAPAGAPPNTSFSPTSNAPPSGMGEPVSLTTGAVFFTHTDAIVGDLVFSRTYNSRRTNWTGYSATRSTTGTRAELAC